MFYGGLVMSSVTFADLEKLILAYNPDALEQVRSAYQYAECMHEGQLRDSGEPYIVHPLNVAIILAQMHADCDTICAGLLHDTLEDTKTKKEDLVELFNMNVANLVDGVTKFSKVNFSSKKDCNMANMRKIIAGIIQDVRIIIIKLADKLHNMRTLGFKEPKKQKENSLETMEIFVPLAQHIGVYEIKEELEDICLSYLEPDEFQRLKDELLEVQDASQMSIEQMLFVIECALNDKNIPHEIKMRTKNIYSIYKELKSVDSIRQMHDLLALRVLVKEIEECYLALGYIHQKYHPVNACFKDYICNPKANLYQSLHTTVFGPNDYLVQMQIRTLQMENVANRGLTAYWYSLEGDAGSAMQEDLQSKFQFFDTLTELDSAFSDNQEFVNRVKRELLTGKIYVYTTKGDVIELPEGATPIDFAYKIHTDVGNAMVEAYVNERLVSFSYRLQNNDRVRIEIDPKVVSDKETWLKIAQTTRARRRIRDYQKRREN